MIRKCLFLAGSVLLSTFAQVATAASPAMPGEAVQIGCTVPSTTGATVYSVDKSSASGGEIALPAIVKNGSSCTQAVNSLLGESISTNCSGGFWVLQNGTPMLVSSPTSGYALQYFVLRCTAP